MTKDETDALRREASHLPPLARARAERELGVAGHSREHRVFVYGTLLTGERNAHWARGARRYPAWTRGTLYDTGMGFPALTREGATRIPGELLVVDDEGFASMDTLEGYPRLYRREEIDVFTDHGRGRAWVYIMNSLPRSATVIECGDWRNRARG